MNISALIQEYLPYILGGLGLLIAHRNGWLANILKGLLGGLSQPAPKPVDPNQPAPAPAPVVPGLPTNVLDLLRLLAELLKGRKQETELLQQIVQELKPDAKVEDKKL